MSMSKLSFEISFPKWLGLFSAVIVQGALIQGASAQTTARDAYEYEKCLAGIAKDAHVALDQALAWEMSGGGAAAEHCAALALLEMGQEEEAAMRLEALSRHPGAGYAADRAEILSQAAQAWMMVDRVDEAQLALTSAIELDPHAYHFVDRAQVHRMRSDLSSAVTDLTRAIALDGDFVEAYVMRAGVRRQLGDIEGAVQDIDRALKLEPQNVEALLERGRLAEARAGRFVE